MADAVPAARRLPAWGIPAWEWGDDLCAPFVDLLPVSGASISVFRSSGSHSTVCSSDVTAARLDAMQFELGEGPRWEVARTGSPAISTDAAHDAHPDWPVFGAALAALGVGALFSFPIMTGAVMMGVVDLYRRTPGALGRPATTRLRSLARRVAAPAVREAVRSAGLHVSAEHPNASALRRVVHQAVGMIFVQLDTTTDEALALLRSHAFSAGRPIEEVARDVVARRLDFRHLPD